jgi:hypothetical protein
LPFVKLFHRGEVVTVQISRRESWSKQVGCRKNIIKEGSGAGLERKNIGIVERNGLLPRVRVTTARRTVVCMYIQREKVCDT